MKQMNDYLTLYEAKKTTPEKIAQYVKSGWICGSDIGLSTPPGIIAALDKHVFGKETDRCLLSYAFGLVADGRLQ